MKIGHLSLEEPRAVARRYLRGWFAVDALSALPIELILLAAFRGIPSSGGDFGAYLALQSLTLIKLFKAGRIFGELQEALSIIPSLRRLILFAYWLAAALHIAALGWILIGATETQRPPFDQYLRALYWVITTIATIGYGDYYPNHDSNLQVGYTVAVELFGVGMYSYVIANVSSLISNLDVARSSHQRRLDEVSAFMRARRIPAEIQARVRDYYAYLWTKQRGAEGGDVLEGLPRGLAQEIRLFLNRALLSRSEIFKGAGELFIEESVRLLRPQVFLPGEAVIRQGEYADCMYFLESGEMRVLVDGKEVARLGPGSPFGETALIDNSHRNASIISGDYGSGYRLDKDDFNLLRSKYPEFDRQVQVIAAKRKAAD